MQMSPGQNLASDRDGDHGSIVVLAVLALVVGAVSGFVGALFLLLLERADRFRNALIVWAHSKAFAGFLVVSIACAAGAAVAAWLVRRYSPHGERHPTRRGGAERGTAAGAVSHHTGEIHCRGAGDRFGAGA